MELPLAPRCPENFSHQPQVRCDPSSGKRDTGMPPSVAPRTLSIEVRGATKKRPSHRVQRRFSNECCAKNTQFLSPPGAATARSPILCIFKQIQFVMCSRRSLRRVQKVTTRREPRTTFAQNEGLSPRFSVAGSPSSLFPRQPRTSPESFD